MQILVDTREQSPWLFADLGAEVVRQGLPTGDYCLPGDEYAFVIERKSGPDWLGTIGQGWARFCRQMNRARQMVIIVEAPLDAFGFGLVDGSIVPPVGDTQMQPQFLFKRFAEVLGRYGVSLFFCANREHAERMAWTILHGRAQVRGLA